MQERNIYMYSNLLQSPTLTKTNFQEVEQHPNKDKRQV